MYMKICFRRYTNFYKFTILFIILMLFDCFITPSAYSALHSGRVGSYSSSTTFTLNPAYILVLCVVFVFLTDIRLYKNNIAYWLCITMLIAGVLNNSIFSDFKTCLFDTISILIVSTIAISDAFGKNESTINSVNYESIFDADYRSITKVMLALFFAGLALIYIAPGRFGVLYFKFTRSARGEVTIWNLFFVSILLLIIAINKSILKESAKFWWIIALTACFITLSTLSRTQVLLYLICLAIAWIEQKFDIKKLIGLIVIGIIILIGYEYILDFFLLGQQQVSNSLGTILNGRLGLWQYYWELFISHPIIGYGQVSISEQVAVSLGASSEIGILKSATNYGVIFAIIELYVIAKAVKNSFNVIRDSHNYDSFDHMMTFLLWCSFPLIIQQHARILNYSDFLFWYTTIYMYYRNFKIEESRGNENALS